jgi:hypothetical protein
MAISRASVHSTYLQGFPNSHGLLRIYGLLLSSGQAFALPVAPYFKDKLDPVAISI